MAKQKTVYICTECGGQSPKWQGQCPSCHAWNTLVESAAETPSQHRFQALAKSAPGCSAWPTSTRPTCRAFPPAWANLIACSAAA